MSLNVYESAAARDTWLTAPNVGDVAILKSTGEMSIWYGASIGWRPPWNVAWGEVARAEVATFTQFVNVMNLEAPLGSVTFTPVAGRRYEVHWRLMVETAGSGQAGAVGMALVTVFGADAAGSFAALSGQYTLDGIVLPQTNIPTFYPLAWRRQIYVERDITLLVHAGVTTSLSFQYAYGSPLPGTYSFSTTTDGIYGKDDPAGGSVVLVTDVGHT